MTWSFAQRLIHASEDEDGKKIEYENPPFQAQLLVNYLKEKINHLRYDVNQESRLPGLTITDHVLIEGTQAFPYLPILLSEVDSDVVKGAITDTIEGHSMRYYLADRC